MQPIVPMEPMACETIPQGENWIAQVKWDGVRVLTYFDGHDIRLFNRRQNERTMHYPEITEIQRYCRARSMILDGEVIALGADGKPSFHEVMRRDGIRRMEKVNQIRNIVPITYMIFDVIFANGEWVNHRPLRERMELLTELVTTDEHIQLVSSHEDGQALFEVIRLHEMEGIVVKDVNSSYAINGKSDRWQKKKFYKDLIAVVGGVTFRGNIVNALLLGSYNRQGQLIYIGHAGTAKWTQEEWRSFTRLVQPLIQKEMPFFRTPPRHRDAVWLKPELTVKIKFAEWTHDGSLRQPSIQALVDISPENCVLD